MREVETVGRREDLLDRLSRRSGRSDERLRRGGGLLEELNVEDTELVSEGECDLRDLFLFLVKYVQSRFDIDSDTFPS